MTVDQVVKHFGSVAKTALALKMTRQAIYAWRYRGGIPKMAQYHIQVLTEGRLLADAEKETPQEVA